MPVPTPAPGPHRDLRLATHTRRILHLDVDAFLASVEQARQPKLRGKPVIVGGAPTSRNLVMSCSYEARAEGVHAGMRSKEAARLCPRAIFLPGDSQAANAKRSHIARILLQISPRVQIASIDDFFIDLTGSGRLLGPAFEVAVELKQSILTQTAMPVTIGIGTSKLMARMAGKLGKPGGVAEVLPHHECAFLAHLPIKHLPGVGHVIRRRLESFHIQTIGQLALVSREVLFTTFGVLGLTLHDRARGLDPDPVESECSIDADGNLHSRAPRSIRRDSTFEPEEGRREQIEAMLAWLIDRAAGRLRSHGLCAGSLEVRLVYVDTRTPAQQRQNPESKGLSARKRLRPTTQDTATLLDQARILLHSLPQRRALVKRIGISLLLLKKSAGHQGELFSNSEEHPESETNSRASRGDRQAVLDRTLDELRERHGFGRVLRGDSLPLLTSHPLNQNGFVLRTPSLNQ
jgi:DNA polymerase-4